MSVGLSRSLAHDVVNPFMVGLKSGFLVQRSGSSMEIRPSLARCVPLVSDLDVSSEAWALSDSAGLEEPSKAPRVHELSRVAEVKRTVIVAAKEADFMILSKVRLLPRG